MGAAAVQPPCVASLSLVSSPRTRHAPLCFSHFWCKGRILSSDLYHNQEKKYKAQFPGSPKSRPKEYQKHAQKWPVMSSVVDGRRPRPSTTAVDHR